MDTKAMIVAVRELVAKRAREYDLISPSAAKALAASRLINDGIYFRDKSGTFRLHPNYGGDPE